MKNIATCLLTFGLLMLAGRSVPARASVAAPTKEEMVAFVKKAVDYVKKNGKKKAFAKFSNHTDKDFHIGELYIYAYDYKGVCLAHGYRSALIGADGSKITDPDGLYVIKELAKIAKENKHGFLKYKWSNPVHNRVEEKLGYVEDMDGEYWIGSGIYSNESAN